MHHFLMKVGLDADHNVINDIVICIYSKKVNQNQLHRAHILFAVSFLVPLHSLLPHMYTHPLSQPWRIPTSASLSLEIEGNTQHDDHDVYALTQEQCSIPGPVLPNNDIHGIGPLGGSTSGVARDAFSRQVSVSFAPTVYSMFCLPLILIPDTPQQLALVR
jgi:hypothetical protein